MIKTRSKNFLRPKLHDGKWCSFAHIATIIFLSVACMMQIQFAFAEEEMTSVPRAVTAPGSLSTSAGEPNGEVEIVVHAPELYRHENPPMCLLKRVQEFDKDEADKELPTSHIQGLVPPVRVTNLRLGEYYIGVRVPLRGFPSSRLENLAWDGAHLAYARVNYDASGMFYVRWYRVIVKSNQISLLSALFFIRDEGINRKLEASLSDKMPRYRVSMTAKGNEVIYGVERFRLGNILERAGKVFVTPGFFKNFDPPVERTGEYILFLPDKTSGTVYATGHETVRAEGDGDRKYALAGEIVRRTHGKDFSMPTTVADQTSPKDETLLPPYGFEIKGGNPVRVRNPNPIKVTVGLRKGQGGADFEVPANETATVHVPDGRYDIYFVYSNKPDALFKGDDFTLAGNGVEIQIVKLVGGNYGIRQVK